VCIQLNHGIDLSADGKTLFASTVDVVYAYNYDAASMKVGAPKTIISGMVGVSLPFSLYGRVIAGLGLK
jgi:hypothetical protein